MKNRTKILFIALAITAGFVFSPNRLICQPTQNFQPKEKNVTSDLSENTENQAKEEAEKLEEKEKQTKETIEEKKKEAEAVTAEVEKTQQKKKEIEEKTKLIEQEAATAKKEAEFLKKEAEIKKDTALKTEAAELIKEAEKLEKEARINKEKIKVLEEKEETVKGNLSEQQKQINSLQQQLKDITLERANKRGFLENLKRSIPIVIIGLLLFFILRLSLRAIEKFLNRKTSIREDELTLRMKTLTKLINWIGTVIIIGLVIYLVLENFGFSIAPLLAGAGIVGLAFGFGGQYLIRDLINGLFILIEDQYRINDVVKIGEFGGLVEDINLRITTLRDLAGRVIIVPNGEIKIVVNYTKGYSQALMDIGVAYKENVDQVIRVIKELGQEMRKDPYYGRLILAELEMFGIDEFANSAVVIKFRIKTLPIKQWEVMREFRRRLKNRFDELGIEIPFPHTTLYWGTGKDNDWLREFTEKNTS